MHRAIAVQLQLANTGAILSLYQRQITQNLGEDYNPQLMEKLRQIAQVLSRLIKVQAEVAGRAMATLWLVRRHLWLSQSRLQQEDRACRMKLPVEPSVMFGQRASALLQRAQEARCCAREVSGTLGCRRGGRRLSTTRAECPQQPLEDLRSHLEAARRKSQRLPGRRGGRAVVPSGHNLPPDGSKNPACHGIASAHHVIWAALGADPWVVFTMTHGYWLQFARAPP